MSKLLTDLKEAECRRRQLAERADGGLDGERSDSGVADPQLRMRLRAEQEALAAAQARHAVER